MDGWMDGWMGGWVGFCVDGWMDGWIYLLKIYQLTVFHKVIQPHSLSQPSPVVIPLPTFLLRYPM